MVRILSPSRPYHRCAKNGMMRLILAVFGLCAIYVQFCMIFSDDIGSYPLFKSLDSDSSLTQQMGHLVAIKHQTSKTILFLGIFCTQQEQSRRQYIRETMLGMKDPRLCMLHEYTSPNSNVRQDCQIIYTFVTGSDNRSLPTKIPLEKSHLSEVLNSSPDGEDDVVTLAISENMNDGKTPSFFRYAALLADDFLERENLRVDYIAEMDSDVLMNMTALGDFLDTYLVPSTWSQYHPTYGGLIFDFLYCGGSSHCHQLKGRVYMSGGFYFMSQHLVRHITSPKIYEQRFAPWEDMNTGFQVATYTKPIAYVACNTGMFWRHGIKKEDEFRKWWKASQNGNASAFFTAWGAWKDVEGSLG